MDADDNLWCIKLSDGNVRSGTLEQLDEAFQAGAIDENTLVLGDGSSDWVRLGDLLGLDSDASASEIEIDEPTRRQLEVPTWRPADSEAFRPAFARPEPSVPQTTASLSPMTSAVDDGIPIEFHTGSRKKRVAVAAIAIASILGAGAFVAFRTSHAQAEAVPPVAAAVYVPPPPEAPAPPPVVATAAPAPAAPQQDSAAQRLSEEQRQHLQTADKARAAKTKVQKSSAAPQHQASKPKVSGFTTGGSKFDPLNASF
jgi:hypothetical protein